MDFHSTARWLVSRELVSPYLLVDSLLLQGGETGLVGLSLGFVREILPHVLGFPSQPASENLMGSVDFKKTNFLLNTEDCASAWLFRPSVK